MELVGGLLMRTHDPLQVVVMRYAAHLLVLVPLGLMISGGNLFRTRRPVLQLLRGFCMFLMPLLLVAAMREAGASWGWSVFWMVLPLCLAASMLLGERPPLGAWLVAGAGVVGGWLLRGSPTGFVVSTALALGSAAAFGGYLLLTRVLREERLTTSLLYTAAGALLPTLLITSGVPSLGAGELAPALGLGLLSLVILGALDVALASAGLAHVLPWLVLIPVLEEIPGGGGAGVRAIFGGVLILGALALWVAGARSGDDPAPPPAERPGNHD